MKARRLNTLLIDMLTQCGCLFGVKSDKSPAMSGAILSPVLDSIQDEFKPEEADLKHKGPAFHLMIPIQLKAKGLRVEGERTLTILDEEHAPAVEVFQSSCSCP